MRQGKVFSFIALCIIAIATKVTAQESLDLKKCIEIAIDQNITVKQSKINVERNNIEVTKSKMAILPSFNAYVSEGFSFGNALDYTTYEYVRDKTNSNYFQINSDLTVFQGFSKINTLKSNQYKLNASVYNNQNVKDQVILQVASAYLSILMNTEQLKLAEEQIQLTKTMLEKTQVLVDVGQETKSKLLELNAELASNEMNLVESQNRLEQSYLTLKQLLNWDMSKSLSINKYSVDMLALGNYENINVDNIIKMQLSELPQVKKAKAELESAQYSYKAAKAMSYPGISMQSNVSSRYSSVKNPLTGQTTPFNEQIDNNFGQYITFGLNIPIFNNLNAYSNIQYARLNIKNAELAYREIEITAKNTIYESWFNLKNAINKYNAAVRSQEAQKLLFEQSSLMYKEGLLSYYEWQSARNNLSKAETSLLNAKYECIYRIKVFDYYRGIDISL